MPTKEQVRQALRNVLDPEIGRPIEDIGMLRDIEVDGGHVTVHVWLTIDGCPLRDRINSDVTQAVRPVPGVERVDVTLTPMGEQQRQELVNKLRGGTASGATQAPQQEQFFTNGRTTVIAVASGKGGVGK